MTEQERFEVWQDWMAKLSAENEPVSLTKQEMYAAVVAADLGEPLPAGLSAEAGDLLQALVTAKKTPPPIPRRKRSLLAIRADLNALTNQQKLDIWNALNAGAPPLWSTDTGEDAAALSAHQMIGQLSTGAAQTEARLRLAAIYTRDNPGWLPAALGIDVLGDEPDV